jgi:hypothetical protein
VTGITNLVVDDMMAMAEVENREFYVCCFELLGKKVYGRRFHKWTFVTTDIVRFVG